VRHSLCGNELRMKEPYNTGRFTEHISRCTGPTKKSKLSASNTRTLTAMSAKFNWDTFKKDPAESSSKSQPVSCPCPGLTAANNECIAVYLNHTPATGGGAPSLDSIVKSIFPKKDFTSLSDRRKLEIQSAQCLEYQWHNHADFKKVYSASCCKNVQVQPNDTVPPCSKCLQLLQNKNFKQALLKERPEDKNYKFMPRTYLNEKTLEQYGLITGLKPIINAHRKVSLLYSQYCNISNGTFGFRICVRLASFMHLEL
jgi:hypothetical protein